MARALLLDADGVLQYPTPGWITAYADLGDGLDFVRDVFESEKPSIDDSVDLRDQLAGVIERRGLSITPEQILDLWYRIDVDEHMLALVARARAAGVLTALTTNQQRYRGRWMQQNLPYADYFDATYYSFELGLAKPDPAYFAAVLDGLGVAPEDAVFVDDLGSNVAGARAVGIPGVVFSATDSYGSLRLRLRGLGIPGF